MDDPSDESLALGGAVVTERMRRGSEEGGPRARFAQDKEAERLVGDDCIIAQDADVGTAMPRRGEVREETPSPFGGRSEDVETGWLGLRECARDGRRLETGFGLWDLSLILFGLRSSARSGSSAPKSSAASRSSSPRVAFTGVRENGSGSSVLSSTTTPFTPFSHSPPVVASSTCNACITSAASLEVDKSKIDAALESGDGSRLLPICSRLNGDVGMSSSPSPCIVSPRYGMCLEMPEFSASMMVERSAPNGGPGEGKGRTIFQSENERLKNSRRNTVVFLARS